MGAHLVALHVFGQCFDAEWIFEGPLFRLEFICVLNRLLFLTFCHSKRLIVLNVFVGCLHASVVQHEPLCIYLQVGIMLDLLQLKWLYVTTSIEFWITLGHVKWPLWHIVFKVYCYCCRCQVIKIWISHSTWDHLLFELLFFWCCSWSQYPSGNCSTCQLVMRPQSKSLATHGPALARNLSLESWYIHGLSIHLNPILTDS